MPPELYSHIFGTLTGHATSHRLTQDAVNHIDTCIGEPTVGFHVTSYQLPEIGSFGLENDLYGPTQYEGADGVVLGTQKIRKFYKDGVLVDRDGTTPICGLEPRPASHVVVVWAFGLGEWCAKPLLITMYGHGHSVPAPKEPWDRNITPGSEEHLEAEKFWSTHAVSYRSLILT